MKIIKKNIEIIHQNPYISASSTSASYPKLAFRNYIKIDYLDQGQLTVKGSSNRMLILIPYVSIPHLSTL